MKLIKYRVKKFRSVQDSGWITLDKVNALLGENESGKTNLLLPLWKLNPASSGEIDLLYDSPRGEYSEIRDLPDEDKPQFITAVFKLDDKEKASIKSIEQYPDEWLNQVNVSRRYDGKYLIGFPDASPDRFLCKDEVISSVSQLLQGLNNITPNKSDVKPVSRFVKELEIVLSSLDEEDDKINSQSLKTYINSIDSFDMTKFTKSGGVLELRRACLQELDAQIKLISTESPCSNSDVRQKVLKLIPDFIYYSNYGNLDGQIYLPRVIDDMESSSLTEKEQAKVRTLKVLFEYVKLKPREILELGKDLAPHTSSESDVEKKAKDKHERTVLLDSASTSMTKSFAEWWRQGNYSFRFQADGDHFIIWVKDSVRDIQIELQNRSTGLQWFFSFFLVFLNERHDSHYGSVLLLDEPGVTLHPMAQKDLFMFFEGLSNDNQIIYTTHSPFLMDPDKLDQVKAVYVDEDGYSKVSSDLRAKVNSGTESEQKAIYPVHSALGLTVSEVLFIGCRVILVEGPSDQYYLNGIKNILIGLNKISPGNELVFVPAGGTRGIKTTSKVLSYKEDDYPFVFLDGDSAGNQVVDQLKSSLYEGREELISQVTDYVDIPNAEVEDFIDVDLLIKVMSREYRGKEEDFDEVTDKSKPIIPQLKDYCNSEGLKLESGWKVNLARKVRQRMAKPVYQSNVSDDVIKRWTGLFNSFLS